MSQLRRSLWLLLALSGCGGNDRHDGGMDASVAIDVLQDTVDSATLVDTYDANQPWTPVTCDGTGMSTCPAGQVCSNGVCSDCGGNGGPCCPGDVCNMSTAMCLTGVCINCGFQNAPCCTGATCRDGSICNPNTSECDSCGGPDQACCPGNQCTDPSLLCDSTQTCHPCGLDGHPCCAGSTCNPGNECRSGSCVACGSSTYPCCAGHVCTDGSTCNQSTNLCQ